MIVIATIYTRKGHNLAFLPEVTQLESARREYIIIGYLQFIFIHTMDEHVETLIKVLQTGDEWDAADAAVRLGRLRATQAVPALIVALHSKEALKDWTVLDKMTKIVFGGVGEGLVAINALRCAAANALGEIGDEKAIPELLTVLNSNNSDDLDIHDAVAKALANFIT